MAGRGPYGSLQTNGNRNPTRQIETRKLLADSIRTAREAEEIGFYPTL